MSSLKSSIILVCAMALPLIVAPPAVSGDGPMVNGPPPFQLQVANRITPFWGWATAEIDEPPVGTAIFDLQHRGSGRYQNVPAGKVAIVEHVSCTFSGSWVDGAGIIVESSSEEWLGAHELLTGKREEGPRVVRESTPITLYAQAGDYFRLNYVGSQLGTGNCLISGRYIDDNFVDPL